MKEEKRASLPAQSPRTWHGMTASVWFKLLWRNRFAVSPTRMPMAVIISGVSGINSVLRMASEAMYRGRAERVVLEQPPLFIIGHWRTGTTWLHELIVKDERMSFPTTYQCMAPHHFLLTDSTLSWFVNLLMPRKRPMDEMPVGMSRPQEDEFALMNLGLPTPYLEWAFPNRGWPYDDYLTLRQLEPADREHWKRQFDWFVRRLAVRDSRRLVLKTPVHTARVATLLELYPDARFVHVVRNPLDTIPSTIRTWTRMTDAMSLQVRREPISEDRILDVFERMYEQFERDRSLIPDGHFCEVRYEDLVTDPLTAVEDIYRRLDLGDFAPARPAMQQYLASITGYKRNVHRVPDQLKAKILARCLAYRQRYGYEEAVEQSPTAFSGGSSGDVAGARE
ncbi:MAG: sulfotransferase [Pirellulaceae bacterium]|nr:sulfotransferase [Pirellulaceae bacterium]